MHGNPTWSFYWRNLILGLRDRWRCIAVDHIGCGLSDKPQDYNYTLQQRIEDLVRLVEHLDLTGATLLAHDWGGAIGLGAVQRLPSAVCADRAVQHGGIPAAVCAAADRRLPHAAGGNAGRAGAERVCPGALTMAVEKPERMTADVRAGLLAPYDSWANRVAVDRFVKDIPFSPRHPTWQTLASDRSRPAGSGRPADPIDLGHAGLVLSAGMPRAIRSSTGLRPRFTAWPTAATTWSKTPTSGSCRWWQSSCNITAARRRARVRMECLRPLLF